MKSIHFYMLYASATFVTSFFHSLGNKVPTVGEEIFLSIFGVEPTPVCTLCNLWDGKRNKEHSVCWSFKELFGDAVICLVYATIFLGVTALPIIMWNKGRSQGLSRMQPSTTSKRSEDQPRGGALRKTRRNRRKRSKSKNVKFALRNTSNPASIPAFGVHDRAVMSFAENAYEYRCLQDSGVFDDNTQPSIPGNVMDARLCIKANCTDHPHRKIVSNDIGKCPCETKEFELEDAINNCPCGARVCPLPAQIGPPRLSSTIAESSSDDELFAGFDLSCNENDGYLPDDTPPDFQDSSSFEMSPWLFRVLADLWLVRTAARLVDSAFVERIRNNGLLASLWETTGDAIAAIRRRTGEGARSIVNRATNLEESLNESFMNDTLDVSDTVRSLSFYGDDGGAVYNTASIIAMKFAFDKLQSYARNRNQSPDPSFQDDSFQDNSYHADGEYSDTEI